MSVSRTAPQLEKRTCLQHDLQGLVSDLRGQRHPWLMSCSTIFIPTFTPGQFYLLSRYAPMLASDGAFTLLWFLQLLPTKLPCKCVAFNAEGNSEKMVGNCLSRRSVLHKVRPWPAVPDAGCPTFL